MARGGKRQGAGRKLISGSPRVTITARVAKETKERLEQLRAEGFPTGQLIDKLVEGFQNSDK